MLRLGLIVICFIVIQDHKLSQFSLVIKEFKGFHVYKLNEYTFENPFVFLEFCWTLWQRAREYLLVWIRQVAQMPPLRVSVRSQCSNVKWDKH